MINTFRSFHEPVRTLGLDDGAGEALHVIEQEICDFTFHLQCIGRQRRELWSKTGQVGEEVADVLLRIDMVDDKDFESGIRAAAEAILQQYSCGSNTVLVVLAVVI